MVFSSALFLFAFLPVCYILHNTAGKINTKNYILIAASLLFYSFGRTDWLLLLIVSAICNYIAGLFMLKSGKIRKTALVLSVIFNLGMLCIFKYANFFTETINKLPFVSITPTSIDLPIGISFFTFQGMSYVIDCYKDRRLASRSFGKVLLYIAFFPQLVAGPIVKYNDIEAQIDSRTVTPHNTVSGIKRFTQGMVKKLFLANILGKTADLVYSTDMQVMDFRLAWLGVICYTLQIYYDFSAYSDMAIGLGKMFGFEINENFRHPYCAASVKEFWRRWHISLSSWFRDYLYIPLGGNRRGAARGRINRIIVFFFTGLWHGASWTFVVWGLWHGLFLMLEDILAKHKIRVPILGRIYTLLVVITGFTLFRADSFGVAADMLMNMFADFSVSADASVILGSILSPYMIFTLAAGIVFVMPVTDFIKNKLSRSSIALPSSLVLAAYAGVFILCMIKLAASSFNPFIYTQF